MRGNFKLMVYDVTWKRLKVLLFRYTYNGFAKGD